MTRRRPPERSPGAPLGPLFGRDDELSRVRALLAGERLVTLVGAPGVGKTRLARELAARSGAPGASFVALAEVRHDDDVGAAFATALGGGDGGSDDAVELLARAVAGRPHLVVVDNAEHVRAACAAIVEALLERAPEATVLVTSRTRLGVDGEHVVRVATLPPGDAAALFAQRARASGAPDPGPPSTASTASTQHVREICRRLDHLPIALEVAASWSPVLTPAQILERLSLVSRDDAMAAAVRTSLELLRPEQRELFGRLSVFAGEFDLAAAEAVAAPGADVLGGLAALTGGSLVLSRATDEPEPTMRYRLLEPLREQAAARLDSATRREVGRRHGEHYRGVAERGARWLRHGTDPGVAMRALFDAEPNLLVASTWAQQHAPEAALGLATDLARYREQRGQVRDARRRLEAALTAAPGADPRLRAAGWLRLGRLAWRLRDYDDARAAHARSLAAAREADDRRAIARSMRDAALVDAGGGRPVEAMDACGRSIELFRAAGDARGEAWALTVLAVAYAELDDAAAVARCDAAALDVAGPQAPGLLVASAHLGLSYAAALDGDVVRQRHHLTATLAQVRAAGPAFANPDWLWGASHLAGREGRPRAALRLAGAARELLTAGTQPHETATALYEEEVSRARERLGARAARRLEEQGARASFTELLADALAAPEPADRPLTRRELEVAALVGLGLSNEAVAGRLVVSRRTVESHVDHLRQKLGLDSRYELMAWSIERRLAGAEPPDGAGEESV